MSQNRFYLFMPCPKCLKKQQHIKSEQWKHGGNCNGYLYIDENAYVHCNKCGKTAHITNMEMSCDHGEHVRLKPTKKEIASALAAGTVGVVNNRLNWFKSILDHL